MLKSLSSIVILSLTLLTSCTFYEPEFKGGEKIKFQELEGRVIKFTAGGNILNENKFAIKVKPSDLDAYIEGDYIGKVHLDKKIKMKRNQEAFIDAPFTATLEKGALFKAMKYAGRSEIQVRLKGKVRVGVWFIGKKIEVNETRTINGANLKF